MRLRLKSSLGVKFLFYCYQCCFRLFTECENVVKATNDYFVIKNRWNAYKPSLSLCLSRSVGIVRYFCTHSCNIVVREDATNRHGFETARLMRFPIPLRTAYYAFNRLFVVDVRCCYAVSITFGAVHSDSFVYCIHECQIQITIDSSTECDPFGHSLRSRYPCVILGICH